jgi:multidrug efflux system membrane fusion protein
MTGAVVKRVLLFGIVAILVVAGGYGLWHFIAASRSTPAHAAAPAIPVTAGQAISQDVPVFVSGLGTVQAFKSVSVRTRVDGQINAVSFTEGQEVKAGDPLFLVDPRPFQALLEQSQAAKQRDEAQLEAAQLVLDRYAKLVAQSFQTQEAYDNQKATVGQLQGSIKFDQAQIDSAQLNLDYAQIRSPIDGRTGARLVDPGNFVQTSQNAVLVTIAQIKPTFVSFTVTQSALDEIRRNQAAGQLDVVAYDGEDATKLSVGKLTLIDNQVDVATGTIHLKATFANADERLWPGEFVNAHLILSTRKTAVTVPAQTVMQGPTGPYVYIIEPGDTVKRQDVVVAATQEGFAVIEKGLSVGDHVVVDGQYRLTDGAKIAAAPQAGSPQAAASPQATTSPQATNTAGTGGSQ